MTSNDIGSAVARHDAVQEVPPPAVTEAPVVTFGVPVFNAERFLPRLLDSLLGQDLASFEVVICDNESTDRTQELCRDYAARDARVRFFENGTNIGQIENFNRTLELARGTYFRWIGADDWLEPDYARHCVEALERNPAAVGVTTFQDHIDDHGHRLYLEYDGERLDSPALCRRFARLMWALTADYRFFDPIYSMMRRDSLLRSNRLRIVPTTDQVLAAEMIVLGPFVHVPACLAHRRKEYEDEGEEVYRRYHPGRHSDLQPTYFRLLRLFITIAWRADAGVAERLRCLPPVLRHVWIATWWRTKIRLRMAARPLRPVLKPLLARFRRR